MKKTFILSIVLLLAASMAWAAPPFVTGGGGASTAAEVVAVFGSGSCSGYLKSDGTCDSPAGTGDVTGPASPTTGSIPKWSGTGKGLIDAFALGTLTDAKWCSFATVGGLSCTQNAPMATTKIGTVTNTKYCLGDGSGNIQCTTDPPAGTGDFKADGTVPMTGVLNANVGLKVGNAATGAGYIQLMEDSDNGTDYSSITGTADAGSYPGFIFAGSQGSQTAYLQASSSLWTWHTGASGATFAFTPLITLNAGLAVKNGSTGAGFINIYEDSDDGSNYVAVKAQAMASDLTFILPSAALARGSLLVGSAANTFGYVTVGAAGKVLTTDGTDPAWSAYTLAAPGAAGAVLLSDGTNWTRSALDTDLSSVSGSDDTVPSAKATKAALDGKVSTSSAASYTEPGTNIPICRTGAGTIGGCTSITDADLSDYIAKALLDAHTVVYATTDNTPAALTVTEQTVVGRATGGNIAAIAIDSDLAAVSANHDTVPSAKAVKNKIQYKSWSFDPKAVCDGAVDRLFLMSAHGGQGVIVTQWKISFEADPTTEVDLDLKRADAWIGVANAAVMDVLDTTNGAASESTAANINGGNAVAEGKVIYLEFGTAYTEANHQIIFEMWFYEVGN